MCDAGQGVKGSGATSHTSHLWESTMDSQFTLATCHMWQDE